MMAWGFFGVMSGVAGNGDGNPSHAIGIERAGVDARARPLNSVLLARRTFVPGFHRQYEIQERGLGPCVTVIKIDGGMFNGVHDRTTTRRCIPLRFRDGRP